MRQVHVQVEPRHEARVLELAREHEAFEPRSVAATAPEAGDRRMIFLNLPNDRVGAFVRAVADEAHDARFALFPRGTLPIGMPITDVHEKVREVATRSSLEIVLGAYQSIGSWTSLLLYAVLSGIVAAYGLVVQAGYILVAAMLIAPMGAPVMVAVIGAAIGDLRMAGRGAARFAASIALLVLSGAVVAWAYGMDSPTRLMEDVASLSLGAGVLAFAAGLAGAESQVQSEHASLVTATATGFLVAAALAPSSALLGMSLAMSRWDYTGVMLLQLALQFSGLVLGGWVAMVMHGIGPDDYSAGEGSRAVRFGVPAACAVALAGLIALQGASAPRFIQGDLARKTEEAAEVAARSVEGVRVVSVASRFATGRGVPGREMVLVEATVRREPGAPPADSVEARLRGVVARAVREVRPALEPFVTVDVLPPDTP